MDAFCVQITENATVKLEYLFVSALPWVGALSKVTRMNIMQHNIECTRC